MLNYKVGYLFKCLFKKMNLVQKMKGWPIETESFLYALCEAESHRIAYKNL